MTEENTQPTPKKKRLSPTERQLAQLKTLDDEQLLARALSCMQALNRRAKAKRDEHNRWRNASFAKHLEGEQEGIYELKNDFLDALVVAGLAEVETFDRDAGSEMVCTHCGRSWHGDTYCKTCHDDSGQLEQYVDAWYVVSCQGFRFHQPPDSATPAMEAVARRVRSHEPYQAAGEIPDVGLTISAQWDCVELMTERLRARAPKLPTVAKPETVDNNT